MLFENFNFKILLFSFDCLKCFIKVNLIDS